MQRTEQNESKDQEDPLHAPFLTPKVWEELVRTL
jgi:hypothetical protein